MHSYLRPLANFALVVEAGSITGAANKAGVSPATISESIKSLEAHVGVPLLERRRRGVVPTARGAEMAEHAFRVVRALGDAFGDNEESLAGPLRISLPVELGQGWFDDAIRELHRQAPGIEPEFHIEDALADPSKFARDLYIRVSPKRVHDGLTTLVESPVAVALVAHAELVAGRQVHEATEMSTLPFICGVQKRSQFEVPFRGSEDTPRLVFKTLIRVSDVAARIALMKAGLGATLCLRPSVAAGLATGTLVELFPGQVGPANITATIGSPYKRPPTRARHVAEILGAALPSPVHALAPLGPLA